MWSGGEGEANFLMCERKIFWKQDMSGKRIDSPTNGKKYKMLTSDNTNNIAIVSSYFNLEVRSLSYRLSNQ